MRVPSLPAAAALTGTEPLLVSQPSATVTITATTISAQASDNSFNDSANGFVAAGFAVKQTVRVTGFTGSGANNIYAGVITAITAGKMTIGGTDGDVIVDDAAGESVTITKWDSVRTTAQDVADLGTASVANDSVTNAKLANMATKTYKGRTSSGTGDPEDVSVSTVRADLGEKVSALTDGATISIDAALANNFRVTLAGNRTLANPTNLIDGQVFNVRIKQDATGSRTLAYGTKYKFPGGAPTLSTAGNAIDFLSCQYDATDDTIFAVLSKAFA